MKKYPLVTVLMATYNGAMHINEQIDSVLSQTYKNIELVIADDGSSDDTVEIIRSYAQGHANVKVHFNHERLGFLKNFEQLLQNAQGQYFALADQDDIWESNKIKILMTAMIAKEKEFPDTSVMVHSDLKMIDEKGALLFPSYARYRNYHYSKAKDIPTMISKGGVMGNTILINEKLRNLVLPFDPHVVHHDYWIAVINELFGHRVSLGETLVSYRIHKYNASNKLQLLNKKNRLKGIQKLLPYQDNNRYKVLKGILGGYSIVEEDKRSLIIFMLYLRRQSGWIKLYPTMVKEGFFKNNIYSHSKLLGRFAWASWKTNSVRSLKPA